MIKIEQSKRLISLLIPRAAVVLGPDLDRVSLLAQIALHYLCFSHFNKPEEKQTQNKATWKAVNHLLQNNSKVRKTLVLVPQSHCHIPEDHPLHSAHWDCSLHPPQSRTCHDGVDSNHQDILALDAIINIY